jgi:deoxyribose-phosphate aldolase
MSADDRDSDDRVLAALDLTRLGERESDDAIRALCDEAAASRVRPAAVCVRALHVAIARTALVEAGATAVAVAAVANFPHGGSDTKAAVEEARNAIAAGADEIDAVYPWRAHLAGDRSAGVSLLGRCKAACGPRPLKAIIETGELPDRAAIRELSLAALDAGADFVKTSTGTMRVGASLEAASVILECLRDRGRGGFKASGGIRTLEQARDYLELADRICGNGWATPRRFRIGSSSALGAARANARSSDE